MIEMNNELINAMKKYKDFFGDIVPLRELPQNTTNKEVIEVINTSIERNVNLLPDYFGYKEIEEDEEKII